MEEMITKPRFERRNVPAKRRRKELKAESTFKEKLIIQLLVSIMLLGFLWAAHSLNISATQYISGKIKSIFTQDIEFEKIFSRIDGALLKLGMDNKTDTNVFGQDGEKESSDEASEIIDGEKLQYSDIIDEQSDGSEYRNTVNSDNTGTKERNFMLPVEGTLASPFGERISPTTKKLEIHKGVDIAANTGVPIKASMDGEVIKSTKDVSFGYYIKLRHKDGIETLYAHCSELLVKSGETVKQGDIIGKVGSTGAAVGPHLHFEIWKDGKAEDPQKYITVPKK